MLAALLVIGVVGLLLLLASFVLGELLEGVFEGIGGDVLSTSAVAGFLSSLGFVGALVLDTTGNELAAVLGGLAAGVVVGYLVGLATRTLMSGGDESTVESSTLVGLRGSVVSDIPSDGLGQVTVVAAGNITRLNARATEPLPAGTPVVVSAVLSPTSVSVERA